MAEQTSQQVFMDELIDNNIDIELIIFPKIEGINDDDELFVSKHLIRYLVSNKLFISNKKFINLSIILGNIDIQEWLVSYYMNTILSNNNKYITDIIGDTEHLSSIMKYYIDNHLIDSTCNRIIEDYLLCSIESITIDGIIGCIKDVMVHKIDYINNNIDLIKRLDTLYKQYIDNYYQDNIINIY